MSGSDEAAEAVPAESVQLEQDEKKLSRRIAGTALLQSSSVTDNSTSIAVKTMKMAINASTIVNIVLNSYHVMNPFEPGGACWIMWVSGTA